MNIAEYSCLNVYFSINLYIIALTFDKINFYRFNGMQQKLHDYEYQQVIAVIELHVVFL